MGKQQRSPATPTTPAVVQQTKNTTTPSTPATTKVQTPKPAKTNKPIKRSKYNRFDSVKHADKEKDQVDQAKRSSWPVDAVVYIGHLPHGFFEEQLKSYFSQYGQVLAVKVARSRKTSRSKGYAFIQFRYPQVAQIVATTMHGYLLMGKILTCHTLSPSVKNPFTFSSSRKYKFINWKRIFMKEINRQRTPEELKKEVEGLLRGQAERREKLRRAGLEYEFPGFAGCLGL